MMVVKRTRARVAIAVALMANPNGRYWGYELSRRLQLDPGMVYPSLKRMLDEGWLADGWERPSQGRPARRYYHLTDKGKAELPTLAAAADAGE